MNKRRYVGILERPKYEYTSKTHKENDANTNPIILDEYSRFS